MGYVISNADRFASTYFGAVASLGLLSLASKLGEMALSIFVTPVEKVWAPYAFAVRDEPDGPQKIGDLYTRYTALSVLLALGISLAAPLAIRLLASQEYTDAAALVPLLAIGCVFSGLASLADIGILIAKQTRWKPFIFGAASVAAVTLQVALVPTAGIVGAALGTALTHCVTFLIVSTVSGRYYRMRTDPRRFLTITVSAGAGFWCGSVIGSHWTTILGQSVAILVGVMIYSAGLFAGRVVTIGHLSELGRQFGLRNSTG